MMTNAQVALTAATKIGAATTMSPRGVDFPRSFITTLASEYKTWLDQIDAHDARRAEAAQIPTLADRVAALEAKAVSS